LKLRLPNDAVVRLLLVLLSFFRGGEIVDDWIVNQVEDVHDEGDGVVHIARTRLLYWDPVLVDDVWLVHVEDLDVV